MSMSTAAEAPDNAARLRRVFFGPLTRFLNPYMTKCAGTHGVPVFGLVSHQGRRSRRTYATPLGLGMTGAVVLIPLTFGADADWCRNVLAAGSCSIKWRGDEYTAALPEVVDDISVRADLSRAFDPVQRFMFRAMGTRHFLRLQVAGQLPVSRRRVSLRSRLRRTALFILRRVINPATLAMAQRQHGGRVAIVEHRGRRSGRVYRTPVEARRTTDGAFVIPLTWGEKTDWFQNVRSAGSCVVRWHGTLYDLVDPQIFDDNAARFAFHPMERVLLRLGGVRFARLQQQDKEAPELDIAG